MQMETFMKENGKRIRQMEEVFMFMLMGLNTMENGETINNTVEE